MVAKIAIGEVEDVPMRSTGRMRSGKAGGKARGERLSREKRSEIAKKAASARWK